MFERSGMSGFENRMFQSGHRRFVEESSLHSRVSTGPPMLWCNTLVLFCYFTATGPVTVCQEHLRGEGACCTLRV